MTSTIGKVIVLTTATLLMAGTAVVAQTSTPDSKAPAKTMKHHTRHHARTTTTPAAGEQYLRAAGSEPAPKASK